MKLVLKNKINKNFAKNHCEIQVRSILVSALYSIKYGILSLLAPLKRVKLSLRQITPNREVLCLLRMASISQIAWFMHGSLTEREGSIRLTSLYEELVKFSYFQIGNTFLQNELSY